MQQLPERFQKQPRSEALQAYVSRKWKVNGWRKAQPILYNPESKDTHYRWIENVSDGLRHVGASSDIVKLEYTGWFVDNFQDETVHGEVYQLPAKNGEPRYVPAVNDPWNNDCACVDFHSVTHDKEDAARDADRIAERWAERERKFQAEESAKMRIEEIETEIKEEYQTFRRIARELRANCNQIQGVTVVKELVKEKWLRTKADIHRLRAERTKIEREGIEY